MTRFTHDNSVLRFCVDRAEKNTISGRLFSRRLTQPIEFSNLSTLVLKLEDVFDQQGFPQAFQRARVFLREERRVEYAAPELSQGMDAAYVSAQRGAAATFEVQVLTRRNSSWQGRVDWLDGQGRQEFSSCLELIRLVYSRLFENML